MALEFKGSQESPSKSPPAQAPQGIGCCRDRAPFPTTRTTQFATRMVMSAPCQPRDGLCHLQQGDLTPEEEDQRVPSRRGGCWRWGGVGWGPAGRAQRGQERDGRGEGWEQRAGQGSAPPAGASRREGTHTCRAQALTRQGQFGAACKRKDRKSGQRRGQAWAERRSEEELEQSCECPKDALEPLARPSQMPTPPSHFSPALVTTLTLFPPGTGAPHAPGSSPHTPSPSWLRTCRCCARLGPGAAPSRPVGRPGPAARWMRCCRCCWDRVWKKR